MSGPSTPIRAFIVALLEVLRRCQWNICTLASFVCSTPARFADFRDRVDRLESEHLGNMDQYRVTREVPLPYSVDELAYETDGGDDDDRTLIRRSGRSSKSRRSK